VNGMVLTCHVDSGANEGEWRWMRQNRYSASCRLCKKKKEVTLVFMRPYISFVSVRPSLPYLCSSMTSLSMHSIFSYVLDDPGSILDSGQCIFFVSKTSRATRVLTPPPPFVVGSGACFPRDKRSECIADHSHSSSAQLYE